MLGSSSCTILGDFSARQCTEDADCQYAGAPAGAICDEAQGVCDKGGDAAGGSGGSGGGASSGCVSNIECTNADFGNLSICNEQTHKCARLTDDTECRVVAGDVLETEITKEFLILGIFVEQGTATTPGVWPATIAAKLAIEEINEVGLPGPDGTRRKVIALICRRDSEALVATTERLVEEVGVDAILGELEGGDLSTLVAGKAKGLFTLATRANNEFLTDGSFDKNGLLWHALGDIEDLVPAYRVAFGDAVAHAIAHGAPADAVRVAVLKSPETSLAKLGAAVHGALEVNGGPLPDENEDSFMSMLVDGDLASVEDALLGFEPHVIVSFAGEDYLAEILPGIEGRWADENLGLYPPVHVVSPEGRYDESLPGAVDTTIPLSLVDRFVGIEFATDPELYDRFAQRVAERYPHFIGTPLGFNVLYDAVYLATYGAHAEGWPPTAQSLVVGVTRLDEGLDVLVGPPDVGGANYFPQGIELLANGENFRFVGTTGPLAWIPETGSRQSEIGTYCLSKDGNNDVHYRFGAQRYNRLTETLVPTGACLGP